MNVLIASVDSLPTIGGVSLMGHHLANSLHSIGHNVVYLGPQGTFVPSELQRSYALVEDLESQTKARGGASAHREDARLRPLLARVFTDHAIEHVLLLHPYYYGIPLLEACAQYGARMSVYFHGFELRSQMGTEPRKHQQAIVAGQRIEKLQDRVFYLIGACDEILTNSQYTRALLDPFPVKPRVRATGCGIPRVVLNREVSLTPGYSTEVKRARQRSLGLPETPSLCYVGRLVETKRVDRVLELCSRTPRLGAFIIGDGPDMARLRDSAARLGVEKRVRFLGPLGEDEKWRYLRAADFLALLSEPDEAKGNVEGFGIALLEGAAAGAVPVTSGTGGMLDVVTDGQTGLVLPPGTDGSGRLLEFASNEVEMGRLVDGAREQLRAKYNWDAVASLITSAW